MVLPKPRSRPAIAAPSVLPITQHHQQMAAVSALTEHTSGPSNAAKQNLAYEHTVLGQRGVQKTKARSA